MLGEPEIRMAPVGSRVIDPDYINIMITGHQHSIFVHLQEQLVSPAAIEKAKAAGAKGFKLIGCTCVGQDLQLRGVHYTEIFSGHAGNNYTSEAILATGAIDTVLSEFNCTLPGIEPICDELLIKQICLDNVAQKANAEAKEFSFQEREQISAEIIDEAIERTLGILRQQRRTFTQRAKDAPAEDGDRVTVDFIGKIDGEPFEGGKAENFQFVIGEGQMLKEFENAVRGMKLGESKTFPLAFPADYHGKEVAGKTADFMATVKKVEAAHLPEVNEQLAKSLGVKEGTVEALRADISKNLTRELKSHVTARNKQAVMDALVAHAELDLPKSSVQSEINRLMQNFRADMKARGVKDADKLSLPEDTFRPQAERRVRLGLVLAEVVRAAKLEAKPEQVRAQIEEMAASYEKPEEVVRYYHADNSRLADVQALVLEGNVTDYVLAQAKVTERKLGFDELMAQQQPSA
jgi:trigger factor